MMIKISPYNTDIIPKTYNPNLKITFSTYAYVCIKNEILKYIKKNEKKYISLEDKLFDDIRIEDTIIDDDNSIIEKKS